MDTGLLILRVVVGLLFVGHGTQKLFGWWGGHGLDGTGGFFESLGYRPGRTYAALAGGSEAGGGALLALGFFTPLAAAALVGVMLNAIVAVHWPNGLWVTDSGYEYPLVNATIAGAFAFAGPGRWSLDNAVGWADWGVAWALVAIAVGIFTGVTVLGSRQLAPAEIEEPAEDEEQRRAA